MGSAFRNGFIGKFITIYIAIIPLLNGLFTRQFFFTAFIILLVFLLYMLLTGSNFLVDRKILLFAAAQFTVQSVSAFFAVNKGEAIYGILEGLFPAAVFFVVSNTASIKAASLKITQGSAGLKYSPDECIIKEYNVGKHFFPVFLSGTVAALINFLVVAGLDLGNSGIPRLSAVIPYANVLAEFLFVCTIAGLYIYGSYEYSFWKSVFVKIGLLLCITAMILTFSRTMWLLSIFLFVLYFLVSGAGKVHVYKLLPVILISIGTASVCSVNRLYIWPAFISSIILIVALEKVINKYAGFIERIHGKALIVYMVVSSMALFFITGVIAVVMKPNGILARLASISFGATELQERFAYYHDVMGILRDFPILGTGAGGWESVQYKYQTCLYSSKYVHSSVFQTISDYGVLGITLFAVLCCIFFYYSFKAFINCKGNKTNSKITVSLIVMNLAILLHSIIDLDFEFPVIAALFWINLALLSNLSGDTGIYSNIRIRIRAAFAVLISLFILLQIPMLISQLYYSAAVKTLTGEGRESGSDAKINKNHEIYKGDEADTAVYKAACDYLEKSIRFNPLSSDAYRMKGEILAYLYDLDNRYGKDVDDGLRLDALKRIQSAERYDRYNPRYPAVRAHISMVAGDFKNSIIEYRELISLQPLVIGYYEELADIMAQKAELEYLKGSKTEALKQFEEILNIENDIKKAEEKISTRAYKLKHKPNMEVTPKLGYIMGKSSYYLGKADKTEYYLGIASTDNTLVSDVNELRKAFKDR